MKYGKILKSVKFGKERILKPVITTKKYLQVHLCKNNIRKDYHIHINIAKKMRGLQPRIGIAIKNILLFFTFFLKEICK